MKLINSTIFKSVLVLLAAVGCGQALGFTYKVTLLENEKTGVKVWNIWDWHDERFENNHHNPATIVQFAEQLKATLIVESSAHDSDLNLETIESTDLENKISGYTKGYSPQKCHGSIHIHKTYQIAKEKKVNLKNAETRQLFLPYFQVSTLSYSKTIISIKKILKKLKEKINNEPQEYLKKYYALTLQQMPIITECNNFEAARNNHLEETYSVDRAISDTYKFTDIKAPLDFSQEMQKGQKNFIIYLGGDHSQKFSTLLTASEMGFKEKTLFDGCCSADVSQLTTKHLDGSLDPVPQEADLEKILHLEK